MSKNLTINQWIFIIGIYKEDGLMKAVNEYKQLTGKTTKNCYIQRVIKSKVYLVDNKGMNALIRTKGSGRPKSRDDSDIPSIIDELNKDEKREIIESWIKEQRDKWNKNSLDSFCHLRKHLIPKILKFHRTSYYKAKVTRKYKYDHLREQVESIFNLSKKIYGSRKIAVILNELGVDIFDRTLRHYMFRWGLITLTRRKKEKLNQKIPTFVIMI
ncbi:hypothetical protein SCHIN_v1c01760 [Spiroplasma chinense]|uniref:Uncharacterized protein n=1 Tax=Spiroplasma chinense TaxID=216932 RepID=A0A5B9Y2V3_9MOLU|nr:hypothetical protein [Spiroplasma chinense]QEH61374.1 hypothetical protein SCHIN_v1c01760 [Spiroplasma chinense]